MLNYQRVFFSAVEGQYATTTSMEPGLILELGIVWGQNRKTHKDILQVYPVYLWYVYLGLFQFTFLWGIFINEENGSMDDMTDYRMMIPWSGSISWGATIAIGLPPKKRHTGMLLMIFIQRILTYRPLVRLFKNWGCRKGRKKNSPPWATPFWSS